jgi:hypothetical protein
LIPKDGFFIVEFIQNPMEALSSNPNVPYTAPSVYNKNFKRKQQVKKSNFYSVLLNDIISK